MWKKRVEGATRRKPEWKGKILVVRKSDCLSISGHENAAPLLELLSDVSGSLLSHCRLFSIPPFPPDPFLNFLCLISPHYFLGAIDRSMTCGRLFLPGSSPLPSIFPLTRQALYYFISSISKRAVSIQVKSHHPRTSDDFKECSHVIKSWSYPCLLHLWMLRSRWEQRQNTTSTNLTPYAVWLAALKWR